MRKEIFQIEQIIEQIKEMRKKCENMGVQSESDYTSVKTLAQVWYAVLNDIGSLLKKRYKMSHDIHKLACIDELLEKLHFMETKINRLDNKRNRKSICSKMKSLFFQSNISSMFCIITSGNERSKKMK